MGTTHGHTASDGVTFGYQLLDLKVQIRERRAQHGGHTTHRLGAEILHGRGLVVYEVRGDELFGGGKVASVQQFLVGATKLGLVLFRRQNVHGTFLSSLFTFLLY